MSEKKYDNNTLIRMRMKNRRIDVDLLMIVIGLVVTTNERIHC